jgi:hypothetical protein
MSYQSVVRDTKGNLAKNTTIGMRISILQGDINGSVVYAETQSPVTNANGLATLVIGEGKTVSGSLFSINWANGPYFIKTETDISGGINYTITGTSQLMSVPYAFHAATAESLTNPVEEADPVFSSWDKSSGIAITESQITDLKHFTNANETDPQYAADSAFIKAGTRNWNSSLAKTIGTEDTARWGKAEADPLFSSWDKSTGITVSESQITDLKHFTNADEADPVFGKSVAKGITKDDTAKWNSKSSFTGSYQDLTNKPTNVSAFTNDAGYQKATDDGDTDPENEIQYIYRTGNKIGISDGGWVSIADAESDPLFSASQAVNINSTDMAHIKNLSGVNTGDQDLSGYATTSTITTGLAAKVDKVAGKGLSTEDYTTTEKDKLAAITGANTGDETTSTIKSKLGITTLSGTNTGDQDLSGLATKTALSDSAAYLRSEIPDVSGFLSTETDPTFIASQAVNITATDITNLGNLSGKNTGDQDLSGLATKTALSDSAAQIRSEIPDVSGFLSTETDPTFSASQAANITATDITNLGNLTGINTGNQDLSGLATKTALSDTAAHLRSEIPDVSGLATTTALNTALEAKVDKEAGKGLSTNDYSTTEQTKLAGIEEGAQVNVNADWDATSGDAQILNKPTIPSAADGSETKVTAGTNITVTGAGTTASPYVVKETTHYIGESYGGGVVFWVDATGQHGLIAATADQSTGIRWYNGTNTTTNAVRDGIGAGMYNTERIIANQGVGSYAAQLCANYQGGGYGDWYLPSKYELNLLFQQNTAVGGFTGTDYWSSTEASSSCPWEQYFDGGDQGYYGKVHTYYVRAVRAF